MGFFLLNVWYWFNQRYLFYLVKEEVHRRYAFIGFIYQ